MPAMEVEINEEEREQCRRDARFSGCAERLGCPVAQAQQRPEDAEVDQQVDENCPAEGRGRWENAPAAHDEHDGEENCRKRRDAQHHTPEQGE